MDAPVVLMAPAKLTLALRVLGRRPDGYHDIDAEMVTLDLADELAFSSGDGLEVEVLGSASAGLPIIADASNLVAGALRHVGRVAHVRLTKRIPAGAGLGGGSADAAAVLRWAGHVGPDDVGAAARLGADVPFCVHGGRARVGGLGERVEALDFEPRVYTLCVPPFGVSTASVYTVWDELSDQGPARSAHRSNDLEAAALRVEPRLRVWRDRLADHSGTRPTLAGSGATWFVPGAFPGAGFLVVRTTPPVASSAGRQ